MSGIDSYLKIAKLTAAAGKMIPFPWIKGAAQCAVVILETIESAAKNGKDLQELAENTVATLVVVRDTIINHGPTSTSCFKDICLNFQTYLNDLLSKLNKEGKPSGIRRFLKVKKILEDISAYRQRVQAAKEDFLIRTTTMTRLALSDVHDEVTTGFSTLTGSVETSERNITSTIKDNIEEIRTWGARQSEDMQNLSARLQGSQQRGLYKGSVWDIIPGDIHIITPVTHSLMKYCTVKYQDSYCTIENSNTQKVICKYQTSGKNREDAMKQLDQDLDFFMKQRHPNLPQIFGVCRSPDLPAIIFLLHGTNQISFLHYLHGLPATQFIQFFFELFQDLQSVSEVLPIESYRYLGDGHYNCFTTNEADKDLYVNEYGKLVFGDLLRYTCYYLGPFDLSYTQEHGRYSLSHDIRSRVSGNPLHSQVNRWKSASSSRKGDLQYHYEAIIFSHRKSLADGMIHWTQTFNQHRLQPPQYDSDSAYSSPYRKPKYALGSILLCSLQDFPSPLRSLVGRIRPWPHQWKWDISWQKGPSMEAFNPSFSFDNESVTIELSWDEVIRNPSIMIHTCWEDSDEIEKSCIAQTSKLDSCLRSRDYGDDLEAYFIAGGQLVQLKTTADCIDKDSDFCHICNTKDQYHHALSLSITAPVIDYETNTITSWPVISCSRVCGMDLLKEENIFTIEVRGHASQTQWGDLQESMVRSTIPELNAEHGFDPARDGTDVCEYFGWPLLEIHDSSTGEWIPNGIVSQSSAPSSVTSDNTGPILGQEHDSAPRGTDVATGSIEKVQGCEASIKTETISVVQHDIST
ncbi:hypothetical protein ARMGADRAFT_1091002 [Armillaria gallica]|uniref:Uncharacterized protein n=1 Tax=Armillaria gallica TaxID=47427 RepID=A0A2H3CRC9_ARMGA|nr:hypothetical protein ARMGADRAFT_1091002 [Armillaria gallica]